MYYNFLHPWDVNPGEAIKIQEDLRRRIVKEGSPSKVRSVAGVDVGFPRSRSSSGLRPDSIPQSGILELSLRGSPTSLHRGESIARAAIVVLSFPNLSLIEQQVIEVPVTFPYIPGLLAFREAPAVLAAISKLENVPDLFIFDAQGYAHPRRMGLAAHLGVVLDKPSIGCAKSKLTGHYKVPGNRVGERSDLVDNGELVGAVVRTRPGSLPLFVSIGHKISLDDAVKYVLLCTRRGNRLPETTRLAHQMASGRRA